MTRGIGVAFRAGTARTARALRTRPVFAAAVNDSAHRRGDPLPEPVAGQAVDVGRGIVADARRALAARRHLGRGGAARPHVPHYVHVVDPIASEHRGVRLDHEHSVPPVVTDGELSADSGEDLVERLIDRAECHDALDGRVDVGIDRRIAHQREQQLPDRHLVHYHGISHLLLRRCGWRKERSPLDRRRYSSRDDRRRSGYVPTRVLAWRRGLLACARRHRDTRCENQSPDNPFRHRLSWRGTVHIPRSWSAIRISHSHPARSAGTPLRTILETGCCANTLLDR